ncbi:sugar porter family MFS transporter [Corynebacterium cystitidis]|uniref:MFS transporter, sugar porter (SP) family n=1 Tax=Corynebacterium cystitidis DSM 20524 TaxID=1121357 RepID=A0A1H9UX32_9CORY|nr:sugar porter family MFS transporter [Corynebacterium cystitidis]WJY83667.1 D-xylose-proton symporter [Corynebacterium cystitidis DSM 20524]SES13888.1 MFS transporter, sugar porter (SP) family [Corynebacterium cystitidis DSM 20524]SNV91431.1 Myo-inositol facilitator 1 [Corynebacterium cystitidis]
MIESDYAPSAKESSHRHDGRLSKNLIGIVLVAALGGLLFGFDSAIINSAVDAIAGDFVLSPGLTGFTVSCALLGAAAGAWIAGPLTDRYGRVRAMLVASALLSISAIGSAFAIGVIDLIVWRFVGGMGVGLASVIAPAYIAEVSPAEHRGRLGSTQQLAIMFGMFVALLTGASIAWAAGSASFEIAGMKAWRWMFLSEIVFSVIYGLLALRLPESPRYLVIKGDLEEASAILQQYVGVSAERVDGSIADIRATVESEKRQSFSDLLGGRFFFRPVVWVGILLSIFQQFCGINVIFYYSTTLWNSVGFEESDSLLISVVTSIINVIFTVIAFLLVDKVGRKKLLITGSAIMTIGLSVMSLAFSQAVTTADGAVSLPGNWGVVALAAANFFVIGFNISWGPVVWVLLGEIFPNKIRAVAMGVAVAVQWIANFIVSTTFPILAESNLAFAYGIYAFFSGLSLIFVITMVKETRGRTLEEMEM